MSALIDEAAGNRARAEGRWEVRLKRAYKLARRRTVAIVAAVAVVYVVLFQTPVAWRLADPLLMSEAPQPADAIVVFAGGAGESGQAGGGYQERVKQAVDLYRAGYAPRMIFSSGFVFAFEEAEVMRGLAEANGVPPEAILLETNAKNTHENVVLSNRILSEHGWRRILLVSSPYHMRRAVMTWRKSAPEVQVTPTPVAVSQFYIRDGAPSFEQLRGLLQEYAAIALYWWRGWA